MRAPIRCALLLAAAPLAAPLSFAGRAWTARDSPTPAGPGPNYFSAANTFVDADGALHLRVARDAAGRWQCAEAVLTTSLGYGTYTWSVATDAAALAAVDAHLVLGLFTYADDAREIDAEWSRWGNASASAANADFAVQPAARPGNLHTYTMPLNEGALAVTYTWAPGAVTFAAEGARGWREAWARNSSGVPRPGGDFVHMNLWLFRGAAPVDGAEAVITNFSFSPLAASACTSDEECNLNGICAAGACACDAGWAGATCGLLDVLPLEVGASGMNELPRSSSWGGSVVFAAEDGLFHMFFSEILGHCPMANWQTNSACFHSTSASAIGPFANKTQVIGAWCHNAIIRQAWDEHGAIYLLWHIGDGSEPGKVVNCTEAPAAPSAERPAPTGDPARRALGGYSNWISYSRSIWGPWTPFGENVLPGGAPGSWDASVVNMAPFPLANGTVLLGYRGADAQHVEKLGAAIAANWSGPYKSVTPAAPIVNASGEDPALWLDKRGNFHMLFHAFATMGGHVFARALAGPWTLSDAAPYNATISWSNGTTIAYAERERPELLLDADGTPLVLYSAVLLRGNGTAWGPSFTAAQKIKTR